jgi:hypothetical protein
VAGTPMYMSPEQANGDRLDHRTDLFSLGSVLYTMCSGRPPFRAPNSMAVLKRVVEDTPRPLREIIPELPDWLCDLVSKLHAKNPQQRFASARDVADLLAKPPSEPTTKPVPVVKPVSQPAVKPRPTRRHSIAVGCLLVVLLLAVGLVVSETMGLSNLRVSLGRLYTPETTPIQNPPATHSKTPATTPDPDPDRRVAQWLRSLGPIALEVTDRDGEHRVHLENNQALPETPFRLVRVGINTTVFEEKGDELADKMAPHLVGIRLHEVYVPKTLTTAGLAKLVQLPALAEVTMVGLEGDRLNDGIFLHLAKLPKLVNVDGVEMTKITGKGSRVLKACPQLQMMTLLNATLTPEGIEEFRQLPELRYLNIDGTPLTDQHAKALAKLQLTHLIASATGCDDVMASRLAEMQTLSALHLQATPLTDKGLAEFKKLKELKELKIGLTEVTEAGIADLKKALPDCVISRE